MIHPRGGTKMLLLVLVGGIVASACSTTSVGTNTTPDQHRTVSYLEEVAPPCAPVGDPPLDPCRFETTPHVKVLSVNSSSESLEGRRPNINNQVLGVDMSGYLVPHIAIRGTARTGTTRCEVYPVKVADYLNFSNAWRLENRGFYYCFVDVAVGEYLIGTGPPTLTVAMHREHVRPFDGDEWPTLRDRWVRVYSDPRARTAAAYEGREMVMLLHPTGTIHVEAWTSLGLFNLWFVGRSGNQLRAVAYEMYLARTDEQRNMMNLALSDLLSQIRAAGVARTARIAASDTTSTAGTRSDTTNPASTSAGASTTVTTRAGTVRPTGGLGAHDPVPVLVTDANYLRDLYIEIGATYEGDDATTVLPPTGPSASGVGP